jgi:hypothetical protein
MNLYESIKTNTLKENEETNWDGLLKELPFCEEASDLRELMSAYMSSDDYSKYSDIFMEINGRDYKINDAKRDLKNLAKTELSKTPEDISRKEDLQKEQVQTQQSIDAFIKKIQGIFNCTAEAASGIHSSSIDSVRVTDIEGLPNFEFMYRISDGYTSKTNTLVGKRDTMGHKSQEEFINLIDKMRNSASTPKEANSLHSNQEICIEFINAMTQLGVDAKITGISKNIISFKTSRKYLCRLYILSNVPDKENGIFGLRFNYSGTQQEPLNAQDYADLEKEVVSKYSTGVLPDGYSYLFPFKSIKDICKVLIKPYAGGK